MFCRAAKVLPPRVVVVGRSWVTKHPIPLLVCVGMGGVQETENVCLRNFCFKYGLNKRPKKLLYKIRNTIFIVQRLFVQLSYNSPKIHFNQRGKTVEKCYLIGYTKNAGAYFQRRSYLLKHSPGWEVWLP